jgi:dimeric dUTPase (all-alpha-NTP-PPase superfamily)
MADRLEEIFSRQLRLIEMYSSKDRGSNLSLTILALIVELSEVLQQTNWKPWKRAGAINRAAILEEMADAFHFFVQTCIMLDVSPSDLHDSYFGKARVNEQRQEEGY